MRTALIAFVFAIAGCQQGSRTKPTSNTIAATEDKPAPEIPKDTQQTDQEKEKLKFPIGSRKRASAKESRSKSIACFRTIDSYREFVEDRAALVHVAEGKVWFIKNADDVEVLALSHEKKMVKVKILEGTHAQRVGWVLMEDLIDLPAQ